MAGRLSSPLALAIPALLAPALALSDDKPTLSGAWRASPLTESWSLIEWSDACGPKPSPAGAPGGPAQIREQGGELSISGAGRAFSTAECWEQMPGVARSSHSQSARGWRTRCSSPPNDSRRTAITTSISATDTSISLTETGDYAFTLKEAQCHATVTRSRSWSLVHREGDPEPLATSSAAPEPPSAPPAPAPPRPSRCAGSSGEAARIEVHPSRKRLRTGESFAFKGAVLDAEGCPAGARLVWSLVEGQVANKASIDASGVLALKADAPEGPLEIRARVGDKGMSVHVDVVTPENYDAMLASTGLDGAGEIAEPAVAVIAAGTVGGRTARGEDGSHERRSNFVAIVAGVAVALVFVGLIVAKRGTRPIAPVDPEPPFRGGDDEAPAPPSTKAAPAAPAVPAARGKICPTCGDQFPGEAEFCWKDGTQLVLLN